MVILIGGATHTGKTLLAQRLLERRHIPYLSIDHLKMGLIRSGQTRLTPQDGEALTDYLWPIVREMAKTAIENRQSLVIEGCYIPFTWAADFPPEYRKALRYVCLVMSRGYIDRHFADILRYAGAIEDRIEDGYCTPALLKRENERNLRLCREHGCQYILIDGDYAVDPDLI